MVAVVLVLVLHLPYFLPQLVVLAAAVVGFLLVVFPQSYLQLELVLQPELALPVNDHIHQIKNLRLTHFIISTNKQNPLPKTWEIIKPIKFKQLTGLVSSPIGYYVDLNAKSYNKRYRIRPMDYIY